MALSAYLWWGFRVLPGEKWQIIATVPSVKTDHGFWQGINFTWYGLLTANAYLIAVAVMLVLLGSVGVPIYGTAILATSLLCCCVPASRIVARIVEKKAHTFTVGGAVFVGLLLTPFLVFTINRTAGMQLGFHIPAISAYAAIAISYAFGEGLGRLACISFGCCYGKPVRMTTGIMHKIFTGRGFIFSGMTKKIAYAGKLEAIEVIPIQAITAVLYCLCGVAATLLYLAAEHTAAFILATVVTQGWRSISETVRADYRGEGNISAYQVMGAFGLFYTLLMVLFLSQETFIPPDLSHGIKTLWRPELILFLQCLWFVIFVYTGRSTVTGATVSFHVHEDRI